MKIAPHPAALVTGGAHRIGRAIALALADDGWAVAIHCNHSHEAAEQVAVQIRTAGGRAAVVRADLAREADSQKLVAQAADAVGPLTCLINNASLFERDEALDVTRPSWDAHMETNLRAPFVLIQDLARQLPEGASGVVVNILDQRVHNLTPHFISYTLSKAGLWVLTQTLALALAPRIRVNAVGPGPVLPSKRQTAAQFSRQTENTPLGRGASPEEICAAVRFILAAPAMTGQMITLDGGQHLGWAAPSDREPPVE